MNKDKKSIELLNEIYEIYDYDINAVAIHISMILSSGNRSNSSFENKKTRIKGIKELLINGDVTSYLNVFSEVLDAPMNHVKRIKKVSQLDITGETGIYYVLSEIAKDIFSDENTNKLITTTNRKKLKKDFTVIRGYIDEILESLERVKK